jgi:hypothetical protein
MRSLRTQQGSIIDNVNYCHSTDCTCESSTSLREIDCDHQCWVINRCPDSDLLQCRLNYPELLHCLNDGPTVDVAVDQCFGGKCDCTALDECGCCCEEIVIDMSNAFDKMMEQDPQ